jgi:hypothetical protein
MQRRKINGCKIVLVAPKLLADSHPGRLGTGIGCRVVLYRDGQRAAMLDMSKEDCFFFGGLVVFVVWTYGAVPLFVNPPEPVWIAAIAGAVSAIFAAVSAAINLFGTYNFRRQLRNTGLDACLSAAIGLKGAVHKTIELKANKEDKIDPARIWGAYEDAWSKWILLAQTFRIAQRYDAGLDFNAPDELSELLSRLRLGLRDANWDGSGTNDIRPRVDAIVAKIYTRGLVLRSILNWKREFLFFEPYGHFTDRFF